MKNTILKSIIVVLTLVLLTSCSSSKGGGGGGAPAAQTFEGKIAKLMAKMIISGPTLFIGTESVADLTLSVPVSSTYGTVTEGVTLNYLNDVASGLAFIVYGNDGVFAAECEPSPLDSTFGPTHPLCQTESAAGFDQIIICFANIEGSYLPTAQAWSPTQAFDLGHGMICYADGQRMLSTHVYTL